MVSHMTLYPIQFTQNLAYADINQPDRACQRETLLIIVIPCTLGLILVTIIIVTSLAIITKQRLINKLKLEAVKVTEKCLDQEAKGEDKIKQFKDLFPLTYRTMADGEDSSSKDSNDSPDRVMQTTTLNGITRIEVDSGTTRHPTRISAEWVEATDKILCLVRDRKKQLQVMHHLSTAIREEH